MLTIQEMESLLEDYQYLPLVAKSSHPASNAQGKDAPARAGLDDLFAQHLQVILNNYSAPGE